MEEAYEGLNVQDIDAYWLQRKISQAYLENDPQHSKKLAKEALKILAEGSLMANKRFELLLGSYRTTKKGYEEFHIPTLKPKPLAEGEELVKMEYVPDWAQHAFSGMEQLNRIALNRNTNGSIDLGNFKIVYEAPMKALVAEAVGNLSNRLQSYGISIKELTG
eukprot:Gb_16613 [translate_table: standard]